MPQFKIAFTKRTRRFTASKVRKAKSYKFMKDIASNVYFRAVDRERASIEDRATRKRKLFVAPKERPDRDTIIAEATK